MSAIDTAPEINGDQRTKPRRDVDVTAKIFAVGRQNAIPCVVNNISNSGAQITVDTTGPIPLFFKLFIPDEHTIANCEVIWRCGDCIGVTFRSVPSTAP